MLLSAAPFETVAMPPSPHRTCCRTTYTGWCVELAQHPERRTAEVRAGGVAPVAEEAGVHDPEPAAAHEDGAPAAAVEGLARSSCRRRT